MFLDVSKRRTGFTDQEYPANRMQPDQSPVTQCFHCALPIQLKSPPEVRVNGTVEQFCCSGCQAVCEVIVNSGNEDFYQHRDSPSPHTDVQDLVALLDKLKIYDKPEIQADFVRTGQDSELREWKEAHLILEEIRCAACLWLNERTLRDLAGVLDVSMDYTSQQAVVRWEPETIDLSEILAAVSRIGYIAHPFDPGRREALNAEMKQRSVKRLIVVTLLGMMVMQIAIGSYFFGQPDSQGEYPLWVTLSRWSSLILTGVILAYPGQLFYSNAWRDLINRTLGMDVPVVLGLSVAWVTSLVSTVTGEGEVYYESIAMFVTFLLFARYAEVRARIEATDLLDHSAKIIPQSVILKTDETTREVAVFELEVGDVFTIKPGEAVPVDAILLSPESDFDESMLNGEAKPVRYIMGDIIAGGSINIDQAIELEVVNTSDSSTLNNIRQLTRKGVTSRPYYIDIADRVAGKFIGAILLIAGATFIGWQFIDPQQALEHSIAVLIVTCPCALALAAPVSLSLCAAGLAKLHVIALRLSIIEKISQLTSVVFDKTGTLTTGVPVLEEMIAIEHALNHHQAGELLMIAATLEQGSEHPFARAIVAAAQCDDRSSDWSGTAPADMAIELVRRRNMSGQGVAATLIIDGTESNWRLGSELFVSADTVHENTLPLNVQDRIDHWRNDNGSVLYLSMDNRVCAVMFISDPLREGVNSFLSSQTSIRHRVILSGDHPDSVSSVARRLGIEEAYGSMLPADKLHWVMQRQQQDAKIFMLGDGINDAPVLAIADVSATFASATDIAKSHSDLLILGKDYTNLGEALRFMRKTRSVIIQNLAWAIAYNLIAIPAAVIGWVTPWMAAIGMSVSSLLVVANSMRLRNV